MDEANKRAIFNAGAATAERIDALQRIINDARFNLVIMNPINNKFNYEIMISACDGLLKEAWGKLTTEERNEGQKIKDVIHKFINLFPIVVNINNELKINQDNLQRFKQLIDIYENKIRIYLEAHDFNSPNKEDRDDEDEL